MSSTGIKNVAGYKYAQVDGTAFVPAGSSGNVETLRSAYVGDSAGVSYQAPSNPVLLGQITPSTNYQSMQAANLYYDSDAIKAEYIKKGIYILGVEGDLDFSSWSTAHGGVFNNTSADGDTVQIITHLPIGSGDTIWYTIDIILADLSNQAIPPGTFNLSDIEYINLECNSEGVSLPSDSNETGYVTGIKYFRNVYSDNPKYVVVFDLIQGGKYHRVTSYNSSVQLSSRVVNNTNYTTIKIIAKPDSGTYKWKNINTHNQITDQGTVQSVKFYKSLLYHVDVKYTVSN